MKRTMLIATGVALGASLAASSAVFAEEWNRIDDIAVNSEAEAMEDSNALEFWPELEADMETAIRAVAGEEMFQSDGLDIVVEVQDVSMSGSTLLTGEGEFNRLEAWVYFKHPEQLAPVHKKKIMVEAQTVKPTVEDYITKVVWEPELPVYYTALMFGFADAVVDEVKEFNLPPIHSDRND